ncbi:MAG TPA: plasmid recombination protein [Aquabacterium sp.]|nr:plasmid recombination protein [Aquabacterium sp.]
MAASADDGESFLLRLKTLNYLPQGKGSLAAAIGHNKRTQAHSDTSHIDARRSHLNQSLLGLPASPGDVLSMSRAMMAAAGFKPRRKDAAIALEGVFSLREEGRFDSVAYFSDCARWMLERFGGDLLAVDVHRDEPHVHCHVLLQLPLVPGGSSGSAMLGDIRALKQHTADFFAKVASPRGLRLPSPKMTGASKAAAAGSVHGHLAQTSDPALSSRLWAFIASSINRDPGAALKVLGLSMPGPASVPVLRALAHSPGSGPASHAAESASDARLQAAWKARDSPRMPPQVGHPTTSDNYIGVEAATPESPAEVQHLSLCRCPSSNSSLQPTTPVQPGTPMTPDHTTKPTAAGSATNPGGNPLTRLGLIVNFRPATARTDGDAPPAMLSISDDGTCRVREDGFPASWWDENTGAFSALRNAVHVRADASEEAQEAFA